MHLFAREIMEQCSQWFNNNKLYKFEYRGFCIERAVVFLWYAKVLISEPLLRKNFHESFVVLSYLNSCLNNQHLHLSCNISCEISRKRKSVNIISCNRVLSLLLLKGRGMFNIQFELQAIIHIKICIYNK